ncbi:tRNA lysidine(34) synthetase TilS [Psychroserpens sp. S379A]|uniref:tRNA lysidine(34) synthetase TilS n=1 Tax=Psychroserpens sp. S379A TaxID=3415137 RepID=UPI003C7CEDF3
MLITISGGLDSVVLTHLCSKLNLDITLAHCNFKLRANESDVDEQFVVDLAEQLGLEVFIEHFDTKTFAETEKLSIQMAARELRYNWFFELAKSFNFDYILTAHHADDNLETFLINLTRGSGLTGLTGIPEINDNIVRPLLPFSRTQLEDYAQQNDLQWREDSSNASDDYLRNKLRHHIIPQLKDMTPELLSNFNTTISNLKETETIVAEHLNEFLEHVIEADNTTQVTFKISEFNKVSNPKAYLFEVFKDYGFTEWNDVVNLLKAQSGKQVLSKSHRLLKDRDYLILTNRCPSEGSTSEASFFIINENDKVTKTPFGTLNFEVVKAIEEHSKTIIYIDKDQLQFPLQLRKWEKGDVFYPFGMQGKKKLSKYFKDEKLSLVDKENVWLLTSEDKIVWVIARRADNRFKVTENTTNILKIQLTVTSSVAEKS